MVRNGAAGVGHSVPVPFYGAAPIPWTEGRAMPKLTKAQKKELTDLCAEIGYEEETLSLTLGVTTICRLATTVKIVSEVVEIMTDGCREARKHLELARRRMQYDRLEDAVKWCSGLKPDRQEDVPESIASPQYAFLPDPDEMQLLKGVDRGLSAHAETLELAAAAFRTVARRVRPPMKAKAGKTKHKWENFAEPENHPDLAAAYIARSV